MGHGSVGVVGIGAMGLPMARNLVAAGYAVHATDPDERRRALAREVGCELAGSPAETAATSDVTLVMVASGDQAEEAVGGDEGASRGLGPGKCVVLGATVGRSVAQRLAATVSRAGADFVDAPVSGGVIGAEQASLTVMVGAAPEVYERALPVLRAVGTRVYRCGDDAGDGQAFKLVNQVLCGVHLAAAGEALAFAEALGLDSAKALEVLGGGAAGSWILKDRGPRMLAERDEVVSALDLFVKDLALVLEEQSSTGMALPMTAIAAQLFRIAKATRPGPQDDSAIVDVYRRWVG